jgi:Fuc2NAc and GlcNAc transferase
MPIAELTLGPLLVFLCAVGATGMIRRFALRTGLLDHPTQRSSHVQPTPRSGGGAIVIFFLAALTGLAIHGDLEAGSAVVLILGGAAIAAVGFIDDRRSLSASVRFCVHLLAAILAVLVIGAGRIDFVPNWGGMGKPATSALAVLGVVWSTNLFNFMDGIDGIAGSQAVFVAGAGALICGLQFGDLGMALAFTCLGSATAGFLIWNWPPAKIFMGDVGSGFLGFSLAGLGLLASRHSGVPVAVWVILNGIFLVDATVTLLRRMSRGERWFEPHRLHAYQYLSRRWKSHLLVTLCVSAVNMAWLLPWAWFAAAHPGIGLQCALAAILPIVLLAFVCRAGAQEV